MIVSAAGGHGRTEYQDSHSSPVVTTAANTQEMFVVTSEFARRVVRGCAVAGEMQG